MVQVSTVPELEHHQLPQAERVISPASQMLTEHAVDELRLKVPALPGQPGLQRVDHKLFERAAEPRVQRHGKALLPPAEHFRRQY